MLCWSCVALAEETQDTSTMSTTNGPSVVMLNGAKVIGNVRRMAKGCITWRGTKTVNFSKNSPNFSIEF